MRLTRIVAAAVAWAAALACVPHPSADPVCEGSTVTAKRGLVFISDSGEQPAVFKTAPMMANALLPRAGSGRGYVACSGSEATMGQVVVDNVPDNAIYAFQIDDRYLFTQQRAIDFNDAFIGRLGVSSTSTSTTVTLDVSNLGSWNSNGDDLELYSSNGRVFQFAPETLSSASNPPTDGDTTLAMTLDWNQLEDAGLLDAQKDVLLVNQLESTSVATGTASVLTRQMRTMVGLKDGQSATINGTFSPLPMQSFATTWARGAFQSQLVEMAADATAGDQDFFIGALPEGASRGEYDFVMDLWAQGFVSPGTNDLQVSGSFGMPSANLNPIVIAVQFFPVARAGETVFGEVRQVESLDKVGNAVISPQCNVVLSPKLDGHDLLVDSPMVTVGATPSFTWKQPSPAPDMLRIQVAHAIKDSSGAASHEVVAVLMVPGSLNNGGFTQLDIPEGVLLSGEQYYLMLDSMVAIGWAADTTPLQPPMPQCTARIITQLFTVSL